MSLPERQSSQGRAALGRSPFLSCEKLWMLVLLGLVVLVYWPGLRGPFLFDDAPNIIQPLSAWLEGITGWREIVFGNSSGIFRRPVANATFLANAATTGLEVLPFKLINLLIHLLCGMLVYILCKRLITRDARLQSSAHLLALSVCALWLLHPMQVSTVLYVVQRMAQLSALFMLLALLAYLSARTAQIAGRQRAGLAYLFLLVPAATLTAILSKENGALVPLLCAVIELGCFRPSPGERRPLTVKLFFTLFLLLPGVAGLYWFGIRHPLTESYSGRLFTLSERLMSESRALFDYMGALLLPRGQALGIYTDDFAISRGLLDPPTTLLAIVGLAILFIAAFWSRRHMPLFFTGIGLYFGGHVVESTVFPLQIYFEHRNYLPSFGFFLAVATLIGYLLERAATPTETDQRTRRLVASGALLLVLALATATAVRSYGWSSMAAIAEQGALQHPESMRAQIDYANSLQIQGRIQETSAVFEHMKTMRDPAARHVGLINTVTLQCMAYRKVESSAVRDMASISGTKLQLAEMLAFENLGNYLHTNDCDGLGKIELANIIVATVDAAPQPQGLTQIWRNRFVAAQLYFLAGARRDAETQAALAWIPGSADAAVGIYLANVYRINGDNKSAALILRDTKRRVPTWDKRNLKLLSELEQLLKNPDHGGNLLETSQLIDGK